MSGETVVLLTAIAAQLLAGLKGVANLRMELKDLSLRFDAHIKDEGERFDRIERRLRSRD